MRATDVFVQAAHDGDLPIVELWCDVLIADVDTKDAAGWTALLAAAAQGHVDVAQFLLTQGASTESRTEQALTALHLAVNRGSVELIELLFHFDAYVDARGVGGITALHIAQERRLPHVVACLLDHDASVTSVDDHGNTALMRACLAGDASFVIQVADQLDKIGDVDLKRQVVNKPRKLQNVTPLLVAAGRGDLPLAVLLVRHGAELETKSADGFSPLSYAVSVGHAQVVEVLLASGADTETTDREASTPLVTATKKGFGFIVDMLLQHGARSDHKQIHGVSALYAAATGGKVAILQSLLRHGADSEIRQNEGKTPLLEAAHHGHIEVARLLINNGADINSQSFDQWTPLAAAVQRGHTVLCELLLERGALTEIRTKQSFTPLHLATAAGNTEMVSLLCRFGADVDAQGQDGFTPLHIAQGERLTSVVSCLLTHGASAAMVDDNGDTVFMHACLTGDGNFVDQVVGKLDGVGDANVKRELVNKLRKFRAMTPLLVAADRGDFGLVMRLVHHGAELEMKDVNGSTPLSRATAKGHEKVVRFLLANGANKETTQGEDLTPLVIASKEGLLAIVRLLVKHGANTDHKDVTGASALYHAAVEGHAAVVEDLLKHGANSEIRQHEGGTPLIAAAQCGHLEVCRLLLDHGANIDCRSDDYSTPLTIAALAGRTGICRLLLERGALTTLQTTGGFTALHLAASSDHREIIELLLEAGASSKVLDFDGRSAADLAMIEGHFTTADFLERTIGASQNELDDEVWPPHILRELYRAENTGHCDLKIPRQNPAWFIGRSSIASIEPVPQLSTLFAKVSLGTWSGSRVAILEPVTEITEEGDLERNYIMRLFQREVSKLYPLRHPHLIRLYGACHRGERPFLVMEHPQSCTLRSFVAENKHRTWAILHQVALGLQYLHERGIIHGELTGDNIVIGDDGQAKLSAFGLFSTSLFGDSALLWKAPEAVMKGHRSYENDVYSLGICIIEAVAGELPYACEAAEKQDVKKLIARGIAPRKPTQISTHGWELVLQMILSQGRKRLKISDVVRELAALARDEALKAVTRDGTSCAVDSEYDMGEAFALAFAICRGYDTNGDEQETEQPHRQVLHRLSDAWKASDNILPVDRRSVLSRVQDMLKRFTNDLQAISGIGSAARFAAQRQHADRVFSFHNEIDHLVDQHRELLELSTMAPEATSSWREHWYAHRRLQLQALGASLKRVHELNIETSTCLLFELNKRRDAYTSIPPAEIHSACCTLRSMRGVHVPKWFIPQYEVAFDAYQSFSRGAFGSVHHGEWMGSRVVIKKMFADDGAEFEKEVELWSQLYHPHVLQLFGACHVGQKFLVSEFAAHGQLDHYLRGLSKQPAQRRREVWRTLHEAAVGLLYLHSRGIVHCDLKCNNLLIGVDGKAKVSDYGLSRKQQLHDKPGDKDQFADMTKPVQLGATRWKAPEVLSGAAPTIESDIYSFGMCVVEAVTGEYPWGRRHRDQRSEDRDELVSDHVRSGGVLFDKPSRFSDPQWALVVGACRFDPKERLLLSEIVTLLHAFVLEAAESRSNATLSDLDTVAEPESETTMAWRESLAFSDAENASDGSEATYCNSW